MIRYLERPSRNDGVFFDLVVCSVDPGGCRTLYEERQDATINHNGAYQRWVDDSTIALSPMQRASDGTNTASSKVIDVDARGGGAVVFGPYPSSFLGDNTHDGKILIQAFETSDDLDQRGLWELNTQTASLDFLVGTSDVAPWIEGDPAMWFVSHAKYSRDGSHLAFVVEDPEADAAHLFVCSYDSCRVSEPGFELSYWGTDKPMHFLWFDDDTLMGHDSEVNDGMIDDRANRRWTIDKSVVETLAGPGNHQALSPDRSLVATESWYASDPTELYLYRRGETEPMVTLASLRNQEGWDDWEMIWTDLAHVNPSFSRDGTRLYYMWPAGGNRVETWTLDLRELLPLSPVDVAVGATASGEAAFVSDGDAETIWVSTEGLSEAWLKLEYGGERRLRRVDITVTEAASPLAIEVDGALVGTTLARPGEPATVHLDELGQSLRVQMREERGDGSESLALGDLVVYGNAVD